MDMKIALAGNPNCGKTTLFNALTGSNQYVGNWPGVTVEKKEGRLKGHRDVVIQDLPGIYSLSPYTLEEVVARSYLVKEKPDAILNIVDGTNIERNLYLTTQLIELGLPVVVAVNMIDLVRKNGDSVDLAKLGNALGCDVVEMSALKGEGGTAAAAPFVMELPAYHAPSVSNVLRATWERGCSFIKRAGTVILLSTIVLWFLQGYGFTDGAFGAVEDNNTSLLAAIGSSIAWIFYPLGWTGDMAWKATVASFTGLIAKENVVATFGSLYHFAGEISENGEEIWALAGADFGAITAYSFMIFNLLCAPCFAAMGAIKREMNNPRWTAFAISYMCVFAYVAAMIVYQLGGLIAGIVSFNLWTIVALAALAGILYLLFRKGYQGEERSRRISSVAAAVQ